MTKHDCNLVLVSKDEIEFKKWEIDFSQEDGADIISYKKVFIKFLNKCQHAYASMLWLGKYRGKEEEAYLAIETIEYLKKEIENTEKKFIEYQRAAEEEAKKKELEEIKKKEEEDLANMYLEPDPEPNTEIEE